MTSKAMTVGSLVVLMVIALACIAEAFTAPPIVNNRPVIGIITQPVGSWSPEPSLNQYIAASYVKWIESAGARVVPLLWDTPQNLQGRLMQKLNGVVYPGGGADLDVTHPYYKAIDFIFSQAKKMNDEGKYFPVWGTCLGFEEVSILASGGDDSILVPVDAENYTIALNLTSAAASSRLLGSAPANVRSILTQQKVTMNNHQWGVKPETYETHVNLRGFYTVLSTNTDRIGRVFASTVEGNKYPFYATQWHPEKPQFEWNPYEVTPHWTDAIIANAYTAEFFVTESRRSTNHFISDAEADVYLIYRHTPTYTFPHINDFEQCYFFA